MLLGVDLGGTKIEAAALGADGAILARERVPTPAGDYDATLASIAALVASIERMAGRAERIGVGIPGSVSPVTGLVRNANSTWINGRRLGVDLAGALDRPVRIENDANCLAVSEAVDGAAAGRNVVFAVILGTGCGAGLAIGGKAHGGRGGVAGEFGHNPLPWAEDGESPGPQCWCGKRGCIETWLSGPGLTASHAAATGRTLPASAIAQMARAGAEDAAASLDRYADRLARALASVVNLLDPDVIVLGGGLSNVDALYPELTARIARHVFADHCDTPVLRAVHGDSSGVRGAAWLWRA